MTNEFKAHGLGLQERALDLTVNGNPISKKQVGSLVDTCIKHLIKNCISKWAINKRVIKASTTLKMCDVYQQTQTAKVFIPVRKMDLSL